MSTMIYKGYAARIEYSDEDACFIGHIARIKDVIGFHADSVKELRAAFIEAVDDYLTAQSAKYLLQLRTPSDDNCLFCETRILPTDA